MVEKQKDMSTTGSSMQINQVIMVLARSGSVASITDSMRMKKVSNSIRSD